MPRAAEKCGRLRLEEGESHLLEREADGTSLFDNTTLVFGSNIRTEHSLDNCPTLVAGRGAGIKLGQNLVFPKNTPLCNAWLTILKGSGVKVEKHGDSTGVLDDLVA